MSKKKPAINALINSAIDPTPPRFPKPAKSMLTIFLPGQGTKIIKIKELSPEEIQLPDGDWIYTGVAPSVEQRKGRFGWKNTRMHYMLDGMPCTYSPQTGRVFSDAKKRERLLARGRGVAVEFKEKTIVIIIDRKTKEPKWKDQHPYTKEVQAAYTKAKTENTDMTWAHWDLFVKANKEKLDAFEHFALPVISAIDLSDTDSLRAETGEICKSMLNRDMLKSMHNLGKDKEPLWYVLMALVAVILVIAMFLWAAGEGTFDKRDPPVNPQALILNLLSWVSLVRRFF